MSGHELVADANDLSESNLDQDSEWNHMQFNYNQTTASSTESSAGYSDQRLLEGKFSHMAPPQYTPPLTVPSHHSLPAHLRTWTPVLLAEILALYPAMFYPIFLWQAISLSPGMVMNVSTLMETDFHHCRYRDGNGMACRPGFLDLY